MTPTRRHFSEELASLEEETLGTIDLVCSSLDRVLEAVEHQDVELAGLVVADDDAIDRRYIGIHEGIVNLIARQAPVATDLRLVAALLHSIKHIERMGDQCVNVAKLTQLTGPLQPIPPAIRECVLEMGGLARDETRQAKQAFARRDAELAADLVRQDRRINELNRRCFRLALDADAAERECAMYMTMIARALERVGDNAVDIGEQVAFVVTGLFREFADASHPPGAAAPA